jgi:hypothetical protein
MSATGQTARLEKKAIPVRKGVDNDVVLISGLQHLKTSLIHLILV